MVVAEEVGSSPSPPSITPAARASSPNALYASMTSLICSGVASLHWLSSP